MAPFLGKESDKRDNPSDLLISCCVDIRFLSNPFQVHVHNHRRSVLHYRKIVYSEIRKQLQIESLNCMLCTTCVLWNHDGLRRSTLELFRFDEILRNVMVKPNFRYKNDSPIRDQQSVENVQDLYFDALRKEWR